MLFYELSTAAIAARRPSSDESLDEFIEGVTRVPTVQLKKALVEIYKVSLNPRTSTVQAAEQRQFRKFLIVAVV